MSNSTESSLVAISIGNTRTAVATIVDGEIQSSRRIDNAKLTGIAEDVIARWEGISERPHASVLLASVNAPVADSVTSLLEDQLGVQIYRVGDDLPVPIGTQLDPETLTGIDRLLNAAAAYDKLEQACVVVDAGTAITVDFVDGAGTFHGGAIAPGANLQLQALHQHTAALPDLEFEEPDREAFGRSTAQAMLKGVFHGLSGLVWRMTEQYAERFGAYPIIVVTGGDAETLFEDDELINHVIPDLTLLGIAVAARHALAGERED